ncbi:LysR family transcriptional regulator [Paraburkholderia sp. SOS3]|jgi:DNA-binding transcriptional LysR family regulator|uniref:LysR family transcriptional regulator n=1 Tax=Paraburkholderia sp. SOS3 TaxID=1926494 RepID=UPI00094762A9|nr:LysR family transcriptional regulator [Paraburkholderia sp. SOS3]APR34118.1 LysR family transcriptional regulator [Paraburkholderia sp. SOS3]
MNQLQAMRVFMRVVELSSFSVAGRQLGMSAAAVTRSVSMLEAHLNMRLLNRSTRSLSLTETGRLYLEGCRAVIEKFDQVESDLLRATRNPSGMLRIAAPVPFANTELAPLFRAYRLANPRVEFEVTSYDTQIDMIEGGFDICFATNRHPVNASLVSRKLIAVREVAVASPAYLAERGIPPSPLQLAQHDRLTLSEQSRVWEFSGADGVQRIEASGPLSATGYTMVRAAALAGMGIALLPYHFVAGDLAAGALKTVLPQYEVTGGTRYVSIVYSGRNYLTTKVRNFIDFTVEQFRQSPAGLSGTASPLRAVA